MRFDVHMAKPPTLISDSAGHGSRRTYAAVARVSKKSGGFMDVVAVYCHGYCDQHEEVESLDNRFANTTLTTSIILQLHYIRKYYNAQRTIMIHIPAKFDILLLTATEIL